LRRYSKVFPSAQALSNCLWAFTTLRHTQAPKLAEVVALVMPRLLGRGLHSSNFQLNLSRF